MIAAPPTWVNKFASRLTPRRIRAHAVVLALCLWSAALFDFSTSGLIDRAGNIKFQDFLQFYIAGKLVREHRDSQLFDLRTEASETEKILGQPTQIQLPTVYGPQMGILFEPFSRASFLFAALLSVTIGIAGYLIGCWWFWNICPRLHTDPWLITALVLAFPPFFHFVVRGQLSPLVFLIFLFTFYAFRSGHHWWAGFVLGFLIFKPQFLLGTVIIFFAARAWKIVAGIFVSCVLQMAGTWLRFGTSVIEAYVKVLWHLPGMTRYLEPGVAPSQMHSLQSFWILLVPWPIASGFLYLLCSVAVLYIATKAWKSAGPLALRFSALLLATVLVNPHLYVYDLLALTPMFFLTTDWILQHPEHTWSQGIKLFLYLAFLLPLFGPLAILTHVQLSVIALTGLLVALASVLDNAVTEMEELKS
jgi:hypothetical protein